MDADSSSPSLEPPPKPLPRVLICPHCQAENPPEAVTCSTCQQPAILVLGPELFPDPPRPQRFSLGSLMLFIALVAVGLGVFREAPALGVLLLLVVTPAIMRTVMACSRLKHAGKPMRGTDKFEVFAGTIALVVIVGVLVILTFVVVTLMTVFVVDAWKPHGDVLPLVIGLSVIAAVLVGLRMGVVLRHVGAPPDRRRSPHDWRGTRPGSAIARNYAARRRPSRGGS